MPPFYDIYGLSKQRNKETIETFLNYFSNRQNIENTEGQEIAVYKNEKYQTEETYTPANTLTEVISFGIENNNLGFAFYIGDNLKETINSIILKFTFDGKIIFGVSVEEKSHQTDGKLVDNYEKALEIEKIIAELTNSTKTSIQFEYAPSDDEEEFDNDTELWKNLHYEKQATKNQPSTNNFFW
jgi:hypothetical protein